MNEEMERIYTQLCGYYEKKIVDDVEGIEKKHVICNW